MMIVEFPSSKITLQPNYGIVRLQVQDPHFGMLEVDVFQRSVAEIKSYKLGSQINYNGNNYEIAISPAVFDRKSDKGDFIFSIVSVKHPRFSRS